MYRSAGKVDTLPSDVSIVSVLSAAIGCPISTTIIRYQAGCTVGCNHLLLGELKNRT